MSITIEEKDVIAAKYFVMCIPFVVIIAMLLVAGEGVNPWVMCFVTFVAVGIMALKVYAHLDSARSEDHGQ